MFLAVYLFPNVMKSNRINKMNTLTRKSTLSEVNISLIWIITLEYLLLEYIDEFTVCSVVLTNIITSNISPHILVPFILVPQL